MAMSSSARVIDSHLHVWANSEESSSFPYAAGQDPPESLRNLASKKELLNRMDESGVYGSLIVQPINHKFDHSYVQDAIQSQPERFKGMLLHDPSLDPDTAVSRLEDLSLKGFVGVRFNPYLWPKQDDGTWTPMSSSGGGGLAVYKRCAELNMPVGIMCFQGLHLHYEDIKRLIEASPDTALILDHFGFTALDSNTTFDQLLSLAQYPKVYVKLSALFRLGDQHPYTRVQKERFEPLLTTFGSNRLLFGTDFPFVLEQPGSYKGTVHMVSSWCANDQDRTNIMGGTAEALFGSWGTNLPKTEL